MKIVCERCKEICCSPTNSPWINHHFRILINRYLQNEPIEKCCFVHRYSYDKEDDQYYCDELIFLELIGYVVSTEMDSEFIKVMLNKENFSKDGEVICFESLHSLGRPI